MKVCSGSKPGARYLLFPMYEEYLNSRSEMAVRLKCWEIWRVNSKGEGQKRFGTFQSNERRQAAGKVAKLNGEENDFFLEQTTLF